MPYCAECGTEMASGVKFCGNCGSGANGRSGQPATAAPSEKVIFDRGGVLVSTTRYVTGGQTYAMAGVTSVKSFVEQPSRKGPVIAMVLGALIALGGLSPLFQSGNPIILLVGAGIFALGFWMFRKRVPVYGVVLHAASGEQKPKPSTDRDFIEQIVGALNQAIIARG